MVWVYEAAVAVTSSTAETLSVFPSTYRVTKAIVRLSYAATREVFGWCYYIVSTSPWVAETVWTAIMRRAEVTYEYTTLLFEEIGWTLNALAAIMTFDVRVLEAPIEWVSDVALRVSDFAKRGQEWGSDVVETVSWWWTSAGSGVWGLGLWED